MPTALLSNRSAIHVDGAEAEHFLQNILTTDLDQLEHGEVKPGALLSPQGKILFDFLISRNGETGFRLDCRAELADDFVKRLMLYKLRAKAEISKPDQADIAVRWDDESGSSETDPASDGIGWLADRRFPAAAHVLRGYGAPAAANASEDDWTRLRIAHGIAESGEDFAPGDAFPHDVLLDLSGGIGFSKGCYVGQEVVSRMQHRGTARRRVMLAEAEQDLPGGGTELRVNERPIGTLGSALGTAGLAIVRIDRVKDALDAGQPVMAGDVAVTLSIPAWAGYALPQDKSDAEQP
jgi:hypothetical protein